MNYPLLRIGDRLPAVAVLQKLLNLNGAGLSVSGYFGGDTQAAVSAFQEANNIYPVNGIVNMATWARITTGGHVSLRLPIIDCIDVWDMSLHELESRDISATGSSPVLIGGMCNGVEQAVNEIIHAATGRNTFLLRFHGHGAPGLAGVSMGHGELRTGELSGIEIDNLVTLTPTLERLRDIMGPYGCVQFMHCSTGAAVDGIDFLQYIADILYVPVSAATTNQLGGGETTFAYEGPTHTAIPGYRSMHHWAESLPDFPDMYRVRPMPVRGPHSMAR